MIRMSRTSNTDQRRAQITGGLIHVMAARGYDGASIAEIARAADLAPGLVHYHFKNKQEILLAALREIADRHHQRLTTAIDNADGDAARQVAAFLQVHLGLGDSADPDDLACWVLITGEALRQPPVQTELAHDLNHVVELLQTILERGMHDGSFTRLNPRDVAAAVVATIQGYFVLASTCPELVPHGSALRSTLMMVSGLLGTPLPLPPR